MKTKPILIGLDNPYSSNPEMALAPYPEGNAGYRLWRMFSRLPRHIPYTAYDVAKAQEYRTEYMDAFIRINLFEGAMPKSKDARKKSVAKAIEFMENAGATTAILLGHDVRECINLVLSEPVQRILIHPQVIGGITWRWLPHPSGRSPSYNDPVMRTLAGLTLADALTLHCAGEDQ